MHKITNANSQTATIKIYERLNQGHMMLYGIDFFDRKGNCLISRGCNKEYCVKEIRLQEDERVVGLKALSDKRGHLYDVRFKLAKVV